MPRLAATVALFLAATAATTASAQKPRPFCFRARPIAECRSFAIFEVSGATRSAGTSHFSARGGSTEQDLGEWVGWDVGYMRNLDSTHAYGASVQAGGSGGGTRFALRVRRRQWLPHSFTLDVSGGLLTAQQQSADFGGTRRGNGLNGEVALGVGDLVGVFTAADYLRIEGRNASALYVGGKVGSHAAIGATLVAAVGLVILIRALGEGAY